MQNNITPVFSATLATYGNDYVQYACSREHRGFKAIGYSMILAESPLRHIWAILALIDEIFLCLSVDDRMEN